MSTACALVLRDGVAVAVVQRRRMCNPGPHLTASTFARQMQTMATHVPSLKPADLADYGVACIV